MPEEEKEKPAPPELITELVHIGRAEVLSIIGKVITLDEKAFGFED